MRPYDKHACTCQEKKKLVTIIVAVTRSRAKKNMHVHARKKIDCCSNSQLSSYFTKRKEDDGS